MKKYVNPEMEVMLITADVLAASTGGQDNDNDNIYDWGNAT